MNIQTWISGTSKEEHISEAEWEYQMLRDGIRYYEATREGTTATNTVAGQGILRNIIKDCETAIEVKQRHIFDNNKIDEDTRSAIAIFPADTLSLIGLKELLDKTYREASIGKGASYTALATAIGSAVETEANYRFWQAQSKKDVKEWVEENDIGYIPKSIAQRLTEEAGVTATQIRIWKRKFDDLSNYDLTTQQKLAVGDFVISSIRETYPDLFEAGMTKGKRKSTKNVKMTDALRHKIDNREITISNTSVMRKPMLVKPEPWVIMEKQ